MKDKSTLFNPFPGLRSFRSDEDHLFFGREQQTLELVSRLQRNRFIAVVGTSGRGKSSLVRCGLLSRLQGGGMLEAGAHWEIAVMHPGGNPLHHLAEALLEAGLYDREAENAVPQLLATLGRSQFGLIQAVRQAALPAGTNFLLVVDQFEEIFRYDEAGEAESEVANDFIAMLREACVQAEVPVYVVATMRSDFIGDCSRFEGLAETVNRGEYLIPGLSRDQFKSAIEGPIRVAGGQITPRLLQRLLNDLGEEEDQLPCLQHALMRTWRVWARQPESAALDLEHYAQVGKMSQALSVHADEVFSGLASDREHELCAAMFRALTVEGSEKRGIRRPRRLQTLARILGVEKAELIPVIDAFRQPEVSFLMPPATVELRDTTVIDLSHESLMRVWTRLRDWVDDEAKSVGIFRRLSESAALWRSGKTGYYRDPELSIARAWRESSHPNAAWAEQYEGNFEEAMAFLQGSTDAAEKEARDHVEAQQRELAQARALAEAERARAEQQTRFAGRLKWLVRGVGAVAMLALAALVFALAARKEAQENAELARQNEGRATEHARIANDEKKRADAQADRFRKQVYKVQLLRADTALRQFNGGDARTYLQECEESLRQWEWKRLAGRSDQSLSSIHAFEQNTSDLRFSPDGRQFLTTSVYSNGFKIWDAVTKESVWDNSFWDQAAPGRQLSASRFAWIPAVYSPDGTRIAVRNVTTIDIWDVASRRKIGEIKDVTQHLDLHFSPDGESIWSAHARALIQREISTGKLLRTLNSGSTLAAAFSADGRAIVTGGSDGSIRIWNTSETNPVKVVPNQHGWIMSLGFSPDGRRFASGDMGGLVRIHEASSGLEIKTIEDRFKGAVRAIRFSPDGRTLAAAVGSALKIWDAETFEELGVLLGHASDISSLQFFQDGRMIASGDANGIVKFWSTSQSPDPLVLRGHTGALRELAFSPDGRRLVSSSLDGTLRVWDLTSGQESLGLKGHRGLVVATAFSPNGAQIASGGGIDGTVRLWDAGTGTLMKTLRCGAGVWWVAFSPDGQQLVSGETNGQASIWDVKSGTQLRTLSAAESYVEGAEFSPDGKFLATCERAASGSVKIWDVVTGDLVKTFSGPKVAYRCVTFSPDGKSLAVGVYSASAVNAVIWDMATGEMRPLKGPGGSIRTVGFSPDGKRLFGGGDRGVICVWDARNGEQMLTIDAQLGGIWCVKISPDGNTLASSGELGIIQIWETGRSSEDVHRQRRLTNSVRRVVDERTQKIPFAADLISSLQSDTRLEPEVRAATIRLATTRGGQSDRTPGGVSGFAQAGGRFAGRTWPGAAAG